MLSKLTLNHTYTILQCCYNANVCTLALFSTSDVRKLTKEVDTMFYFDHPNVMSLIGVCVDGEIPLLIMPFMAKGSVLEYVKHNKEELLHTSEAAQAQVCWSVMCEHDTSCTPFNRS